MLLELQERRNIDIEKHTTDLILNQEIAGYCRISVEEELVNRIKGLQNQINLSVDKRNDIIRANRLAKTSIDIFNDILDKKSLDK